MSIHIAAVIGNLDKDRGGAQQLLYDVFSRLDADTFDLTVYHLFGAGTYRDAFEEAGVRVSDIDAAGNFDAQAFARFVHQLRTDAPDVLHTNSPISGLWGRLAARLAGIEHVVSAEHNVHDGYPLPHRLANGLTLPLADRIVGVSRAVTDSVAWWERLKTPIETIPNGIDVERFAGVAASGEHPSDAPVVGTLGTHSRQKGFDVLLDALTCLDGVHATLIGDGPARDDLRAYAERHFADRVTFPGRVPSVEPHLAGFDVAAFPSRWEGFGLVAAEAMAAGTPVVASDIPAFREVVGDAGILVPPEDPVALAEGIAGLLNSPGHAADLADRGRERVREHFAIERVADHYAELYRALAERRGRLT